MNGFIINCYGDAGGIDCAMPGEALAYNILVFFIHQDIIKSESHPFKQPGPGIYPHQIIIMQGAVIFYSDLDDRIKIAAFLYFKVGVACIAHQRGPSEVIIAQVVGMIYHP